jgi:hypothetical protein
MVMFWKEQTRSAVCIFTTGDQHLQLHTSAATYYCFIACSPSHAACSACRCLLPITANCTALAAAAAAALLLLQDSDDSGGDEMPELEQGTDDEDDDYDSDGEPDSEDDEPSQPTQKKPEMQRGTLAASSIWCHSLQEVGQTCSCI